MRDTFISSIVFDNGYASSRAVNVFVKGVSGRIIPVVARFEASIGTVFCRRSGAFKEASRWHNVALSGIGVVPLFALLLIVAQQVKYFNA